MIRPLAAVTAFALLAMAGAASAQTWGQPVYLNAYGRPVGGSPMSEVETRSYVGTGYWADGYSDRPRVYVPAPGYGVQPRGPDYEYGRGHHRHHSHSDSRYRPRHDHGYSRSARSGYRDVWGYNDDRPASARGGSADWRSRRDDRDCSCGDVYLYDR